MDSEILEWDNMTRAEKQAAKLIMEDSFLGFQTIMFQLLQGEKWAVNWHHRLLAHEIEQIVLGNQGSTIFNMPPGSGKTETLSIHAPGWSFVKRPKVRNLNLSFSDSLSKRNSRRVRSLVTSKEFQSCWPMLLGLRKDDEWQLLNANAKVRAEMISRSMNGQITGSRGGYTMPGFSGWLNMDDIDKPVDMFSDVRRSKNHDLLNNTVRSRRANKSKENPTPILATQQRLHVYDSTWFMMHGGKNGAPGMGIDFKQVIIPALINEDYIDSLPAWLKDYCWKDVKDSPKMRGYWSFWPANEYVGDLISLWDADEYTFLSQYMQAPISLGGTVFDSNWWKYWVPRGSDLNGADVELPFRFDHRFITADTAQKTEERNDYSVFALWGYHDANLYLLDLVRDKWEAPELATNFESFFHKAWARNPQDGPIRNIYVEDKSSGTGLIQDVKRRIIIPITPVQRNTDKTIRAKDTQPALKAGRVFLPYDSNKHPWVVEFIAEHSSFTYDDTHKHDDQVDNTMDAVKIELMMNEDALQYMKNLGSMGDRG